MIFDIQNSKKGIITVYIPKSFLRESIPTNPIDTGVFVNGQWLNSEDTSNSTHRIRTIDLPDGYFELEFQAIGYPETMQGSKMSCSVVPEFPIVVPVLLIGIVSVIIFYRIKSSFKI